MSSKPVTYTNGYDDAVMRAYSWRSASNSCAYLLPLLKPSMKILDLGCGPGGITLDLAALVPSGHVTGVDTESSVLDRATTAAIDRGIHNATFVQGDASKLDFADGTFDVVHAHQVLQHVGDAPAVLREMKRVAKRGGIVAARDTDLGAWGWYPETPRMAAWKELQEKVARHNGAEPDAGRRLHVWAKEAGFTPTGIVKSASTWCFASPEDRSWWSQTWAERILAPPFMDVAVRNAFISAGELLRISHAWKAWGENEDGWFVVVHGEILCRV